MCIFCKIINKEIPATVVYENDDIICIKDIAPLAPVHVVMMPKKHICSANEITEENSLVVAKIFEAVPNIAKILGVHDDGYRIINNCGENGGQSVEHIHFHLIGGQKLPIKLV